jgi:hypothetical protein
MQYLNQHNNSMHSLITRQMMRPPTLKSQQPQLMHNAFHRQICSSSRFTDKTQEVYKCSSLPHARDIPLMLPDVEIRPYIRRSQSVGTLFPSSRNTTSSQKHSTHKNTFFAKVVLEIPMVPHHSPDH